MTSLKMTKSKICFFEHYVSVFTGLTYTHPLYKKLNSIEGRRTVPELCWRTMNAAIAERFAGKGPTLKDSPALAYTCQAFKITTQQHLQSFLKSMI